MESHGHSSQCIWYLMVMMMIRKMKIYNMQVNYCIGRKPDQLEKGMKGERIYHTLHQGMVD